jgi:hypothetical protein
MPLAWPLKLMALCGHGGLILLMATLGKTTQQTYPLLCKWADQLIGHL